MTAAVKFPGLIQEYSRTTTINLLSADTAHGFQGIGNWVPNTGGPVVVVADLQGFGGTALSHFPTASTTFLKTNATAAENAAVTAGNTYTFACRLLLEDVGPVETLALQLAWRDVADGNVGAETGSQVALVVGAYVDLFVTGVAPAGAVYARTFMLTDGTDFDGTQTIRLGDAIVRSGSDPAFVPSLDISGDLEMEWRGAPVTWDDFGHLMGTRNSGSIGYAIIGQGELTGTRIFMRFGNGTSDRSGSVTLGEILVPGSTHTIKATLTEGVEWEVFVDDVTGGTAVRTDAGPGVSDRDCSVGARPDGQSVFYEGTCEFARVRDGIGGPLVYEFDASDLPNHPLVNA